MSEIETVRRMYDAFNARRMDAALAGLHVDVGWDGGSEGMLHGKQAVERHWRSQWQEVDAKVYIGSSAWKNSSLVLQVRLEIATPQGHERTANPKCHYLQRRSRRIHANYTAARRRRTTGHGEILAQCERYS
jgi:hypothetical protein